MRGWMGEGACGCGRGWLLGVVLLVSAAAGADSTRIRIGTSGDYPPFSQRVDGQPDAQPSYTGFEVALASAWAAERELEIEWVGFRWPELRDALAEQRFDVAMSGVTVRPERSAAGRYCIATVETHAVALVREPERRRTRVLDRRDIRIGVNAGGHLERVARAHFPRATLVAIPDNASVLAALSDGAVDAVVTETHEARLWARSVPGSAVREPHTRDRKAWLVRADLSELAADLDDWLMRREADGTLARLREEHLGVPGTATAEPLRALLAAIDERLSLMPLVGATKREEGVPLEVPEREEQVLDAAVAAVRAAAQRAAVAGPDDETVRRFFQAQMEAAKEVQWRAVKDVDETPKPPYPDLESALRPGLLRIGERIAWLLVRAPRGTSREAVHITAEQELRAPYLSAATRRLLADAVAALLQASPEPRDVASSRSHESIR